MAPLTNAEKQARFRKKEELRKFGNMVFVEAHLSHEIPSPALLDQIKSFSELPSGWNDEDLENAYERLNQIRGDRLDVGRELSNDVHYTRGVSEEFRLTPNPAKLVKDTEKAIEDTKSLAAHLISAVELTNLSSGERAAALVEAMRHVARSLANERPLRRSDANTLCLSTLPPHYTRPDWFLSSLAEWISWRLGDEELKARLGQSILDFDFSKFSER